MVFFFWKIARGTHVKFTGHRNGSEHEHGGRDAWDQISKKPGSAENGRQQASDQTEPETGRGGQSNAPREGLDSLYGHGVGKRRQQRREDLESCGRSNSPFWRKAKINIALPDRVLAAPCCPNVGVRGVRRAQRGSDLVRGIWIVGVDKRLQPFKNKAAPQNRAQMMKGAAGACVDQVQTRRRWSLMVAQAGIAELCSIRLSDLRLDVGDRNLLAGKVIYGGWKQGICEHAQSKAGDKADECQSSKCCHQAFPFPLRVLVRPALGQPSKHDPQAQTKGPGRNLCRKKRCDSNSGTGE